MGASRFVSIAVRRPRTVTAVMVIVSLVLASFIVRVKVDTDPENMLSPTERVRVFHNQMKKEFDLNDYVVLGVVNEKDKDGVFNPVTLKKVDELTNFAKTLSDPDDPSRRVIARNIIAPGTVDSIEQAGLGQVKFNWLMSSPPTTRKAAARIRDLAMGNPLLKGTLVSGDGRALGIYIPISQKDFAASVRKSLLKEIATFDNSNGDEFHITGLPVAEDTFGEEMFIQMAISAPGAMLAIFLLMLLFFRQVKIIIAPMVVAMMSVLCSMGLLIGTGFTLHIMSSMIPIFLMPIAVVDSIHILSEFFDSYQKIGDREKTLKHVMDELFMPMLYTSLTSAAGFASLAVTPIPPVQAFGAFVAIGILIAWVFTVTFVPAYIMMMKEESLAGFGTAADASDDHSFMARSLAMLGGLTYRRAKLLVLLTVAILGVSAYGISKITINDNPVKWFTRNHPIRVADRVLNKHFAGTYEAYLVLESAVDETKTDKRAELIAAVKGLAASGKVRADVADDAVRALASLNQKGPDFFDRGTTLLESRLDAAPDATYDDWSRLADVPGEIRAREQVFKDPAVMRYIGRLQRYLATQAVVGKSNSITDVVKKVHQELFAGDVKHYTVPESRGAVAECLISFQNSHKPDDLFHLVTPDYRKVNIWLQLKNGDNRDMEDVVRQTEKFFSDNPPPVKLKHEWAGLTYLNVVWQDKMVKGMLESFASSFVVVLVMMVILFRSFWWGLLSMVPLTVTIAFIYGFIGLIGKDYDMPVAVLSSLTLGMAVDFSIHFLERSRAVYRKTGSWEESVKQMFAEPARAITRNVIVIAVGFTPLLLAPLVPYQTVGVFLASIMAVSGIATMFILPSLMAIFERFLFKKLKPETREA